MRERLALQQQRLTKRNRAELMIVQEKPVGSHVPVKPKQFKNRNDGKFKGNFAGTKKSQGTVVKCYRCGKPGHIRKNCRTRFTNMKDNKDQGNYNTRKPQDEQSGNEPTGGQFGNEPTEQESSEEQSGNEPTEDQLGNEPTDMNTSSSQTLSGHKRPNVDQQH
ncbi:hypothetical protein EJ110_NYTH46416 [Nymphaea thermarum]|nr:hypothetical protein EJ110_NYTH46416 [Nymphaea thermarum]